MLPSVNRLHTDSCVSPSGAGPPHSCWFSAARNVNSFASCASCSSVMSVSPTVAAADGPELQAARRAAAITGMAMRRSVRESTSGPVYGLGRCRPAPTHERHAGSGAGHRSRRRGAPGPPSPPRAASVPRTPPGPCRRPARARGSASATRGRTSAPYTRSSRSSSSVLGDRDRLEPHLIAERRDLLDARAPGRSCAATRSRTASRPRRAARRSGRSSRSRICSSVAWSGASEMRRYSSRRSASCATQPGGTNAFTGRSMRSSCSSGTGSPFISAIDSCRMRAYASNPTAAMWPDCSAPSMLPAPRISRSFIAIWNPAAERLVRADRGEPLARLLGHLPLGREEEVRERALGDCGPRGRAAGTSARGPSRSARSTTSVFAFGTSRPLSMITVQTSTSASRSQNRIICCSSSVLVHLAVRDDDARLGQLLLQPRGLPVDRRHPVVDPEDLALAQQLAPHGAEREALVVAADVREHRLAVLGRRVDRAHLADAGERHLERARDRRRRHREHVDAARGTASGAPCARPRTAAPRRRRAGRGPGTPRPCRAAGACRSRRRPCPPSTSSTTCFCSAWLTKRLSIFTVTGNGANRSLNVMKCCSARSVVGTSTATCLPSITALNAARTAISVLPNPTSPQIRRSIGLGDSMSRLTSSIAESWSVVSSCGKASSSSRCHGVSGPNAWPGTDMRTV